jgi:hypothetical protein
MTRDVNLFQLTNIILTNIVLTNIIVSYDEAIKLVRFHNFIGYCECSSKNGDRCDEVLDFLINSMFIISILVTDILLNRYI